MKHQLITITIILCFLGVAFAPSINANIGELRVDDAVVENDTLQLESEYQRIRANIDMQSDEDCGCDDANTTEWNNPILCTLLYPVFWFAYLLWGLHINTDFVFLIIDIVIELDCYWNV